MNRHTFLQLTAAGLTGGVLASCASPGSRAAQPAAWPPQPFTRARAFVYDCDADQSVGFFQKDGRQSRGVIGDGVTLNPAQVKRLLAALTMPVPRRGRTACFVPHHAFVFYNAEDQAVAHAEICFNCRTLKSFPAGLPSCVDFPALWTLLQEAGVPVGPGSQFYRDLRRARQPSR
ncbi:MAG: hypothetical protein V4726_16430 [Verrucomicrobiota bacterium]